MDVYVCIYMCAFHGCYGSMERRAESARRILWIGVTGRYSSFCLSSIIIEDTSLLMEIYFLSGLDLRIVRLLV